MQNPSFKPERFMLVLFILLVAFIALAMVPNIASAN